MYEKKSNLNFTLLQKKLTSYTERKKFYLFSFFYNQKRKNTISVALVNNFDKNYCFLIINVGERKNKREKI